MSSTPDSIVLPTPLAPEESEEQSNEELGTEESHVEELQAEEPQAEEPQAEEHQSEEPRTEEPQAGEHQAQQDGVAHAESPTIEASKSTAYRRRLLETVVDLHESGKRPSKDSEIEVLRKSVLELFRTGYETSITLSSYVTKDTHAKHRQVPDLIIDEKNAFQSVGKFKLSEDLTLERIERHLVWNKKREPSSFISAFDGADHAIRRARFHYTHSQRIGHRVFVAAIDTSTLVAATVTSQRESTTSYVVKNSAFFLRSYKKTKTVNVPVWIRDTVVPADRSNITQEELATSGADMWMSIRELRKSNVEVTASRGHSYEWLACGSVPKACVLRVMPFDGKALHPFEGLNPIWSLKSTEPWFWDWKLQMWLLDHDIQSDARSDVDKANQKRKHDATEDEDLRDVQVEKRAKSDDVALAQGPLELTIIRPYLSYQELFAKASDAA
ncbi:hypothetical protein DDE82_004327 [Stemphylium lycopersici]|nr:hypothetical protein TW65_06469 [Stemphylium lycopersici]RAR04848.1 hypothetical protein DDE82_004327 [Stemphylium lycopersici]